MKRNKTVIIIILVFLILTVVLATLQLSNRPQIEKGELLIEYGSENARLDMGDFDLSDVIGEMINGKGEIREISAQGIPLYDVIEKSGLYAPECSKLKVIASDEYSAEIRSDELLSPDKVFLIVEEEKINLIVFGDNDSRRNVSDVMKVVLE